MREIDGHHLDRAGVIACHWSVRCDRCGRRIDDYWDPGPGPDSTDIASVDICETCQERQDAL